MPHVEVKLSYKGEKGSICNFVGNILVNGLIENEVKCGRTVLDCIFTLNWLMIW
jgi:hypothetical protein